MQDYSKMTAFRILPYFAEFAAKDRDPGWNIYGQPSLDSKFALQRVFEALAGRAGAV